MSTLAARRRPDETLGLAEAKRDVRRSVGRAAASELRLPRPAGGVSAGDAVFRWLGADLPSGTDAASVVDLLTSGRSSDGAEAETMSGLRKHVDNAIAIAAGAADYPPGSDRPAPLLDALGPLAMHAPGTSRGAR